MSRSYYTPALILAIRPFGEDNREATLLTPEVGLEKVVVYGGGKSKLRSLAAPFHRGTAWLYHDPVRNTTKLTDFEVTSFHAEIRDDLTRTMAASIAAETVIRTMAGGNAADGILTLTDGFLEGICRSRNDGITYGLMRFLWRYIDAMGSKADAHQCGRCGNKPEYYSLESDAFICDACLHPSEQHIMVTPELIKYFALLDYGTMKESRNARLSENGWILLRHIIFSMVTRLCGSPLKSIETAAGII